MKKIRRKHFNFSAKIVSIFYISLITLFSFDSENFIGLLIHILPSFIFISCLMIAWFKPRIGGILFAISGIGTIIVFNTYRELFIFLVISLIPVIIGTLFWFGKKK
jgi:phosphoglycerol transferase MdoB-like AlkP superfamily enzyme